jgi:hypothetical protein
MSSAGQELVAGRIPGERIATTRVVTSGSAVTTTETTVMTVTAAVVAGRRYRITADWYWQFTVATDVFDVRIREDSVTGTALAGRRFPAITTTGFIGNTLQAEYVADVTEDKVFDLTFDRQAGTGSATLNGAATATSILYVDYIEN